VAASAAQRFLDTLDQRPVAARDDATEIKAALGGPLSDRGEDPESVIEDLVTGADSGIVATAGPRYFGFVIGGTLPAALAADWLVSAWDQCAGFHSLSPAAAAIEDIVAEWTLDLLGLPGNASVGFVTGAQGANTTGLAAARHAVLARAGWDVESDGLTGAPRIDVYCGAQAHAAAVAGPRRADGRPGHRGRTGPHGGPRPARGGRGRRWSGDRVRAGRQRGDGRL
jgi:glutamate/tyrosine decarboxylase-like PLP-dependent enzyme